MPEGVTFNTRQEAEEYSNSMHNQGYITKTVVSNGKFKVYLEPGLKAPDEEKYGLPIEEEDIEEIEEGEDGIIVKDEEWKGREASKLSKEIRRLEKSKVFGSSYGNVKRGMKAAVPDRPYSGTKHPRIGTVGAIGTGEPRIVSRPRTPSIIRASGGNGFETIKGKRGGGIRPKKLRIW